MASYEEVMTALRNAHDAGDGEAATRLAGIAKGLKASSVSAPEKAGIGTGIKQAIAGLGTTADTAWSSLAGGAATLFGQTDEADRIYGGIEERKKARNQWANPDNREIGFGGKLAGIATTLPMQIVNAGLSPAETGKTLLDEGETLGKALGGSAIDAAGNVVGMLLPGFKQGNMAVRAGTGGAVNAAQDYATKAAISGLADTEGGKRAFTPTAEDAVLSGIVGAGGAAAAGRNKPSTRKPPVKAALDDLNTPAPAKPTAEPIVDTKSGLLKSKEAYESALRERQLAQDSAFSPEAEAARLAEQQAGMTEMGNLKGALDSFDELGAQQSVNARQAQLEAEMARAVTEQNQPKIDALKSALDGFDQLGLEQQRAKASNLDQSQQKLMSLDAASAERARAEQAAREAADAPGGGMSPEQRAAAIQDEMNRRLGTNDVAGRAEANNMRSPEGENPIVAAERVAKQAQEATQKARSEYEAAQAKARSIDDAQAAIEARLKALQDEVNNKTPDLSLDYKRSEIASKNAFLRKKQEAADIFSAKERRNQRLASEKAAAELRKQQIVAERAQHEKMISDLRDKAAKAEQESRAAQAKAQEALNNRQEQTRQDVTKQTTLEMNAATRARQEAATTNPAMLGSKARRQAKGLGKKQRGVVDADLLGVGAIHKWMKSLLESKTDKTVAKFLQKFKGTFNEHELVQAYNQSLDPKGKEHLVMMPPSEFHALASERGSDHMMSAMAGQKRQNIREGLNSVEGLDSVPYLMIDKDGKVTGHEGRHRMDVLQAKGMELVPVRIMHPDFRNEAHATSMPKKFQPQVEGASRWRPEVAARKPLMQYANGESWINNGKFGEKTNEEWRSSGINAGHKQSGALDLSIKREGYGGLFKSLSKLTDMAWLKEKFPADKYMTNSDGTPLVMLHGTERNFTGELNASREGIHAGFVSSPHMFVTERSSTVPKGSTHGGWGFQNPKATKEGGNIRPIVLKKGNYPLLKFDVGMWEPKNMFRDTRFREWFMFEAGKQDISPSEVKSLINYVENGIGVTETNKRFTEALKRIGVDGFFYKNSAESPHRSKTEILSSRLMAQANKELQDINSFQSRPDTSKYIEQKRKLESISQDPTSFVTWDNDTLTSIYKQEPTKVPFNFKKQGGGLKVDWSSKQKLDTFKDIPGIKEAARDVANSLITDPTKAIDIAKTTSDVNQNMIQRGFNAVTKGGTYLKQRLNNVVVHFAVDKFLTADGLARGEINQKLGQDYLGSLRSLSKQEYSDAFDLLNAADLNQKTITPEFMQKHGLSAPLQEFIMQHQKAMDDVLGKINTARQASGKEPISAREAYSAMSMSGDYRKVVTKVIDGKPTVVGVIGADRAKGKLGWTLEKIEKHMAEKDPTLQFGPLQDTTAGRTSTKGTPHEAFTDALKTLGENNPHIAELLNTLREVAKDDPSNYMGMQKHTMQKKGVWGMEGRKPWETAENNATQFFENQVKYMEGAYNWSHLSEAAKDVNTVIRDPAVIAKHPNAIALTEKYMENALGLNPSRAGRAVDDVFRSASAFLTSGPSGFNKVAGGARSAANTMMLSLNQSFLMIQAIQGPTGIPAMAAFLRGRGLAPSSTWITQGLSHYVEANKTLVADKMGYKLSDVDRKAIAYAKKNHIYATDMVEHNSRTTADARYYASKVLHAPAAIIEATTRAQAYMTFVKMMDEAGVKPEDGLYQQAHRFTDQVMNNYSAMEKPPAYQALGQIGSMAYNLRSFGHNELSRWSMYARELAQNGNAAPLLTQMASTIALAGVMGLPFYSQWEELYDFITAKLGQPRSLTLDTIKMSENLAKEYGPENYEKWKFATSHGLFSTMGADISKRVGLGDVIPSNATDAAFAGGGKLADMAVSGVRAVANPTEERFLKAAAVSWAPNVVAGPMKEAWYSDEKGVYSQDPTKKRELITQINGTDRLLKKIGITGINESVNRNRDYQLKQLEKTYQGIRDKALVDISHDLSKGKIEQAAIDKYFVDGQGDPSQFSMSINTILMNQNIPRDTRALLNDAASRSITKAYALQRRMEAQ